MPQDTLYSFEENENVSQQLSSREGYKYQSAWKIEKNV